MMLMPVQDLEQRLKWIEIAGVKRSLGSPEGLLQRTKV